MKDGIKVKISQHSKYIILVCKKYLVVGGHDGENCLSSTETWSPGDSSWTIVSPLPRTAVYAKAVSMNNNIYLFGK